MLTLDKFEEASEKVKEVTLETKLIYSDFLSDQTGNKVYLKPENMQFTGAYKVRGAYYKISTLTDEERAKGLITASAGNHAQGVAYAAKCYGCKAVIVMPTTTPLIKVNRTKSYGAEVVLYGDVYDEACAKAYELAEKEGYTFIHPFDDLAVATGQGTIAMEIFKELPLVEYILVPIGGGGLGITGDLNAAAAVPNSAMDIWGFHESQETSEVSPEMFAEFVLPYQMKLAERFGLNYYGCCEGLDRRWDYVKNLPRLRRVSVSQWADIPKMSELLGGDYVFCHKVSPTDIAVPVIDEDHIRTRLHQVLTDCKRCGNHVELIMKDNHTIANKPENVYRWVQIAKEEIAKVY